MAFGWHEGGRCTMLSDGVESEHKSFSRLDGASFVFDDDNEFHYLAYNDEGGVSLRCESLKSVSKEDSVCLKTAKRIYRRTSSEEEPDE